MHIRTFTRKSFCPGMKYMKSLKIRFPIRTSYIEIANIVRNIAWLRATDVFGPIAYNSAGDGSIAPKFDSQEVVYRSMLADLSKISRIAEYNIL